MKNFVMFIGLSTDGTLIVKDLKHAVPGKKYQLTMLHNVAKHITCIHREIPILIDGRPATIRVYPKGETFTYSVKFSEKLISDQDVFETGDITVSVNGETFDLKDANCKYRLDLRDAERRLINEAIVKDQAAQGLKKCGARMGHLNMGEIAHRAHETRKDVEAKKIAA